MSCETHDDGEEPLVDLPPLTPEREALVAKTLARILVARSLAARSPASNPTDHHVGSQTRSVA